MFERLELMARLAGGFVRGVSSLAFQIPETRPIIEKFHEFMRRVQRAGLLFVGLLGSAIAFSLLIHPFGLLLWLVILPLASFSSLLSLLWPTKSRVLTRAETPTLRGLVASTLRHLRRSRSSIPLRSLAQYDRVVVKLKRIEALAGDGFNPLVVEDAKRLTGQHLPRLVDSITALPSAELSDDRVDAFADALKEIAEELDDLHERLASARIDDFEIERQFIANRYSRHGLAHI